MIPSYIRENISWRPLVWGLLIVFAMGMVSSCGVTQGKRSAARVQKKLARKERRKTNALVRRYHKMYNTQTDIQAKAQRKRIKRGRRKPKMMRKRK